MASDPRSAGKVRRLLWLLMISVVAALSVVAAGCGGDDDEAADGTDTSATEGECGQSIWVLLPDSTTSPRWETDDRRYFGEAFTEAGVDYNDRQRRGRRYDAAVAGGAGDRRRRRRHRPHEHRHRLRGDDRRPGEGRRGRGDRVRPLQHRRLGRRGLRELRQRRSGQDDGRVARARDRRRRRRDSGSRDAQRRRGGQQLLPVPRGLRRDRRGAGRCG